MPQKKTKKKDVGGPGSGVAVVKKPDKTITEYMKTEGVLRGFADVMGEPAARAHISSVLIAVRDDDRLMKCEPKSVYISALRAATLRLSVDPATRQAYLVPFKDQCTLLVGYKGLYDLALRTGKYHYINVDKVYEGEEWVQDRLSGIHHLEGARVSDKIIGWFASFEMGEFVKTLYMSLDEIHDHAKKYSKNYNNPKGLWKTNPQVMERKTPLRILLTQYGYIAPNDQTALMAVEADDWIEADYTLIEDEIAEKKKNPKKKKSAKQAGEELGFPMEDAKDKTKKVQPLWDDELIELVISYTPLKKKDEARELLIASGLDPVSASVGAIKQFLIFYQANLDGGMSEKEALDHAKANWTKK